VSWRASADEPFPPDPATAVRRRAFVATHRPSFPARLAAALDATGRDAAHPTAVIPAAAVAWLVADLGLEGAGAPHEGDDPRAGDDPDAREAPAVAAQAATELVMLLAIETARALARPPVSGYRVGAVGLAAGCGDLVLGGNLELPGASIWHTVHGEGFVTLLARARGELVRTLATSQARPCAHCRQVLAEMDGAHGSDERPSGLRLIDPEGRALRLADVYPWPFAPADLGMAGARPGSRPFPDLRLEGAVVPADIADALVAAGSRSHAPYSGAPAAVALRGRDGAIVTGSVLESVAFNPTIGPLGDALVGLLAGGHDLADLVGAWIAVPADARVDHVAATEAGLAACAPGVALRVATWA
jgi:cytidine deaminase